MIEIHAIIFLIVLQILVLAVAAIVFLFYRISRLKQPLIQAEEPQATEVAQKPSGPDEYFTSEIEYTKQQTGNTSADEEKNKHLSLRTDYLQLEKIWAGTKDRDENFWSALHERMDDLLSKYFAPVQNEATAQQSSDQDKIGTQEIINNQTETIESLKKIIADTVTDEKKGKALQASVEKLSQTNFELNHCVAVLEDENGFLRKELENLAATKK